MRLVLDTNVAVSAMLWGGSPKLLLQARREKRAELYTSIPLLAELTDILGRSKFEKKIASGPDDDVVIGAALAAKADLLVTGDRPLFSVDK